jgi:hypothetical protein
MYIDVDEELLQLIVFNFIEYLTSTLRTNLQPGYLALDYSPLCLPQCIPLSYLDSDYYSVSVLEPPYHITHSFPENQP